MLAEPNKTTAIPVTARNAIFSTTSLHRKRPQLSRFGGIGRNQIFAWTFSERHARRYNAKPGGQQPSHWPRHQSKNPMGPSCYSEIRGEGWIPVPLPPPAQFRPPFVPGERPTNPWILQMFVFWRISRAGSDALIMAWRMLFSPRPSYQNPEVQRCNSPQVKGFCR
jgi:hypothetical protein